MGSLKRVQGWWPWAICVVLLLATLLNYMDRQALAVALPKLKAEFDLGERRVGMVEGCFGYAFAVGSLFFGWLADRVGPRYLYPAVLAGWSLAGIATAGAGQPWLTDLLQPTDGPPGTGIYYWLLICRTVLGVFEAGHWPCALLTVRAVLSSRDRTLGNGILQSGASLGAILVPLYVAAADRAGQSWEFPFWSIGLVGLCWVPVWLILVGKRDLSRPHQESELASEAGGQPAAQAASSAPSQPAAKLGAEPGATAATSATEYWRRVFVLAVIVSTLNVSWQFLRAWLALFLQDNHGYSPDATRALMSGYFIAADVGCILSGMMVNQLTGRGWRVHEARVFGFLAFSLLTACGALVPYAGNGWFMVCLLFVTGAGILGLHPFYYALTQEISVRNMGALAGALAAGGWIVSSTAQIYLGRHIEATASYERGLLLVGLAPLIGFATLRICWPR